MTFNPDLNVLHQELTLLSPQVDKIWLVDNASSQSLSVFIYDLGLEGKLQLVQMHDNLGLGAAHNVGIQLARKQGATHLLIMDQDSQPMPDMVGRLLAASNQLQSAGFPLAATAPVYADTASGPTSSFVRLSWFGFRTRPILPFQGVVEADFVMSSGSLIPVSVLDDIGLMDESLFIDHVDTEWCLRAQSKGYKLFGVPAARMIHTLGVRRTRIWFFRWRNVAYHSPFRYYYILRNSLLMQRRPYMPFKWRVAELFRCGRVVCFYGLFAPQRAACLRMMFRGIADGLRGVSGPMKMRS